MGDDGFKAFGLFWDVMSSNIVLVALHTDNKEKDKTTHWGVYFLKEDKIRQKEHFHFLSDKNYERFSTETIDTI